MAMLVRAGVEGNQTPLRCLLCSEHFVFLGLVQFVAVWFAIIALELQIANSDEKSRAEL